MYCASRRMRSVTKQHRHRRTKDFTMEGVHVVGGRARGSGDGSPPVGSRGKAPVGVWGTKYPRSWRKMWN